MFDIVAKLSSIVPCPPRTSAWVLVSCVPSASALAVACPAAFVCPAPKVSNLAPAPEKPLSTADWTVPTSYMEDEMKELHWYDEKMIRIHMEGTSMNQSHRETHIGLTSIKNTIKNGKAKIQERLQEDWEDFQNGDYDKI